MTIDGGNRTSGALQVPASAPDGPLSANMDGTAVRTGNNVRFNQSADTFVRDCDWFFDGRTIAVTDQVVAGARFTISLRRL